MSVSQHAKGVQVIATGDELGEVADREYADIAKVTRQPLQFIRGLVLLEASTGLGVEHVRRGAQIGQERVLARHLAHPQLGRLEDMVERTMGYRQTP